MSERLPVFLGGLLALALVYILLVPQPAPTRPVSRPITTDTGPNGYFALDQWLSRSGIATRSLRRRYDSLYDSELFAPVSGNILVVSMPHFSRPRFDEIDNLIDWVYQGNTLLIMAALHDSPIWIYRGDYEFFLEDLESMTLAEFEWDSELAGDDVVTGALGTLIGGEKATLSAIPSFSHPLLEGVEQLNGQSDLGIGAWRMISSAESPWFELAFDRETELGALWEQRVGDGRIILSGYGSLFANRAIGEADNRQMVTNLVKFHLGADGLFIFDDMHQGLAELYNSDAFFSDPRLHRSLYFIVGFWLLYLLGATNRMGEPIQGRLEVGETDFVRTMGDFIARRIKPKDAAKRMFQIYFNDMRRQWKMPENGQPVWDKLDSSPLISKSDLARLKKQFSLLESGHKPNLRRLHNQITQMRKAFL